MLELDLRTVLPLTRAAFDAGQLQAQTAPLDISGCKYAGPCAIGVAIPPELRESFDEGDVTTIRCHISNGLIVVPGDQEDDFIALQRAHDAAVGSPSEAYRQDRLADFEQLLTELEAKYAG